MPVDTWLAEAAARTSIPLSTDFTHALDCKIATGPRPSAFADRSEARPKLHPCT
jgi:hypothetical protein